MFNEKELKLLKECVYSTINMISSLERSKDEEYLADLANLVEKIRQLDL